MSDATEKDVEFVKSVLQSATKVFIQFHLVRARVWNTNNTELQELVKHGYIPVDIFGVEERNTMMIDIEVPEKKSSRGKKQ